MARTIRQERAKPEKVHKVLVEARQGTEIDDEGIEVNKWSIVNELWCSVENRSGSQKWGEGRYDSEVTTLFTYWWVPGVEITPAMRLRYRGDPYDIISVDNIRGENIEVEIRASKKDRAQGVR